MSKDHREGEELEDRECNDNKAYVVDRGENLDNIEPDRLYEHRKRWKNFIRRGEANDNS